MTRDNINYGPMLLGGALGDAFGSAIEFLPWSDIKRRFGPEGLLEPADNPMHFTDDTQMTLFAAEAMRRHREHGAELLSELRMSIRYWHASQHIELMDYPEEWMQHPLLKNPVFWVVRSPGYTCLQYGKWADGTMEQPENSSKGNGGAMRVAPLAAGIESCFEAFKTACAFAAMTHGHPDGYVSAGALTSILHGILRGTSVRVSAEKTLDLLETLNANESDTYRKLAIAIEFADAEPNSRDRIHDLGRGFTGEEAVAIAVYCALSQPNDFKSAVRLSVNHNGDSDTCGLMTGQIMGASLGQESIPTDWISVLDPLGLDVIRNAHK